MTVWQWDPSLYSGSADYYAAGRMPYPSSVVWALRDTLGLDGTGRLLDVGSGPGTLTIPLAGLFAGSVAVDADADMIAAGRSTAESLGIESISWHTLRAEELPADLGRFRVITFAQSFHWMDQATVARTVAGLLEEGGSVVHLGATTDKGTGEAPRTSLHYPKPPWDEINELVRDYLGTKKRAGQGVRPTESFGTEREVFAAAGFGPPQTVEVPHNFARIRTINEIVAAVFSLSYSAPHLFGDRKAEFEAELRALLASRSALGGLFAEQVGSVGLTFWRAPEGGVVVPPAPRKPSSSRKPSSGKSSSGKSSAAKRTAAKSSTPKSSPAKSSIPKSSAARDSASKSSAPKSSAAKSSAASTSETEPSATKNPTAKPSATEPPAARISVTKRSAAKVPSARTPAAKPATAKSSAPRTTAAKRPAAKTSAATSPATTASVTKAPVSGSATASPSATRPTKRSATRKSAAPKSSPAKTPTTAAPAAKRATTRKPAVKKASAAKASVSD